jgi:hypothetical protein
MVYTLWRSFNSLPEVTEFFDAIGLHLTVGYGLYRDYSTLAFPFYEIQVYEAVVKYYRE